MSSTATLDREGLGRAYWTDQLREMEEFVDLSDTNTPYEPSLPEGLDDREGIGGVRDNLKGEGSRKCKES